MNRKRQKNGAAFKYEQTLFVSLEEDGQLFSELKSYGKKSIKNPKCIIYFYVNMIFLIRKRSNH